MHDCIYMYKKLSLQFFVYTLHLMLQKNKTKNYNFILNTVNSETSLTLRVQKIKIK